MSINISADNFFKKHKKFLGTWKQKQNFDQELDAVVFSNGKQENKIKTSSLNVWYFGYDLIDTILAFTKKTIILIASPKKLKMLDSFKANTDFAEYNTTFLEKGADNTETLNKLLELIANDAQKETINVGHILEEKQVGVLEDQYQAAITSKSQFNIVNSSSLVTEALLIKDFPEMNLLQKASKLSKYFFTKLVSEMENIIEEEKSVSHIKISEKIQQLLENENEIKRIKGKYNADETAIDFSYPPIIQSGGVYNLNAENSNDNVMKYDTIICNLGMSYNQYNSNITRTYFIDPVEEQKNMYKFCLQLHQKLIKEWLKPGQKLSEVYENAVNYIKENFPESFNREKIPTSFGQGIGLFPQENIISIAGDCERTIQNGMVFNIQLKFGDLVAEGKNYAISLSDTLLIISQEQQQSATTEVQSDPENVFYFLNDEEEEEEDKEKGAVGTGRSSGAGGPRTRTRTGHNRSQQIDQEATNNRKYHQQELRKKKQTEMKQRFENGEFTTGNKTLKVMELQRLQTYKQESDISQELRKNQIYIDSKRAAVLLPVSGEHVPININIVKQCTKQDEGQGIYSIRLNFHYPGVGLGLGLGLSLGTNNLKYPKLSGDSVYVKELTFKSKNENKLNDTIKKIKELQKRVKQQQIEKQNQDELADQDRLDIVKGKRPVLKDLKMRPNISNKKSNGQLECHNNGFRYITQRNDHCEITFNNIKHAFFQPCDKEMIVVIHFHLRKPILVNKKKCEDIQFYTEAGLAAIDLNQRRRGGYDDDYEDEEQERLHRKKLNRDFKQFIKTCQEQYRDEISFDKPFRELGFDGAPLRSTAFLQPTLNCLINVVESPPFVLTLEEIEICCFERMVGGLKNFDMIFIFKDYERPVQKITAIPMNKAEDIKNWLDKMELMFFETTKPINWPIVLADIKKDIKGFIDEGGWEPVLEDEEDENNASDTEGDSNFDSDSGGGSNEQDEEISESASVASGSDDSLVNENSDEFSDEELSEEGLSWDELEKQAKRQDQDRNRLPEEVEPIKKRPQSRR